jgi:hypothetical protein
MNSQAQHHQSHGMPLPSGPFSMKSRLIPGK